MEQQHIKFALFGNIYQEEKSAFVGSVVKALSDHGAVLAIEKEFYQYLSTTLCLTIEPDEIIETSNFCADFVICLGGDGTFLKAASAVGNKNIPILGINIGRLGFMAEVSPNEIEAAVRAIYHKEYEIEERTILQVNKEALSSKDLYPCALNEIVVLKHDNSSMIAITTHINGEFLTTYQADGLIVSTPTGSTGYSLSVGGPIIVPQSTSIVLTPVAPHSLNVRPIVLCDDVEITLNIGSRSHNFLVAIDGRSESCKATTVITIKKAPYTIKVVKQLGKSFFCTLRDKLMWGTDQRR